MRKACPEVPIIGTGGVSNGRHIEMLMARATAVGVGSAVYHRGPDVFAHIVAEMRAWLDAHGLDDVRAVHNSACWSRRTQSARRVRRCRAH
ncbi:MAG: hypothetical protein R2838_06535 [Caldilineaceae bacterium]